MSNELQNNDQIESNHINVAENNSGKGKKYPVLDIVKDRFNWGAFFLTWIWGLGNNTYITFLIFPAALLYFIPLCGFFFVLCVHIWFGVKGNEWAWQNKKFTDIKAFHSYQKKWAISGTIVGVLTTALIIAIPIMAISSYFSNSQNSEQMLDKIETTMTKIGNLYFERHVITDDENKYYVSSIDWKTYSFDERVKILNMAATMAAAEKNNQQKDSSSYRYSYSKTTELPKTKIYSNESGKLLAEFKIDPDTLKNGSFKTVLKESLTAYRIYKEE